MSNRTTGRFCQMGRWDASGSGVRLYDSISGVPVLLRRLPFSGYLRLGWDFGRTDRLGVKGERSFNPPESPRFRVGGDANKPQSCKYDNSTIVRYNHCSRFRAIALED